MGFIKKRIAEEFETIRIKSLMETLRPLDQVGTSNLKRDFVRKALPPGKRISKTGNVYWETRKNRSDSPGKKI